MVKTVKQGASKKSIKSTLESLIVVAKPKKGIDAYKYVGKINLKKNPLTIQYELRNEWE